MELRFYSGLWLPLRISASPCENSSLSPTVQLYTSNRLRMDALCPSAIFILTGLLNDTELTLESIRHKFRS
jgi:hypothetical protein